MPPSWIADTWSPAELRQAEALARLEGWGQEKRRTAAVMAELHNVFQIDRWSKSIDPKRPVPPLPTLLNEGHFLPRRARRQTVDPAKEQAKEQAKREASEQKLRSIMNGLCGYG